MKRRLVTFNMATYQEREQHLQEVVESILPQCDLLRIYLNDYGAIPKYLKHSKIHYHKGEDIKDTGKFYWADKIRGEYYFTADDDLIYAPGYASKHITALRKFGYIVCSHGRLLKPEPRTIYDADGDYPYYEDLDENCMVNYAGTGTVAFNNSIIKIPLDFFKHHGMADEYFSLFALWSNYYMVCRKHSKSEIKEIPYKNSLHKDRTEYMGTTNQILSNFK